MAKLSAGQRVEIPRTTYDILLIEDDEATCEMLTECIESQSSYCVWSLSSGEAVLQHLQEIREAAPSLFIIDFLLPGMTGLQLFDHLHSLDAFEQVPAIMLTAVTVTEDIQAALHDRSMALLSKPFELANLLDYVEYVLTGTPQQLDLLRKSS